MEHTRMRRAIKISLNNQSGSILIIALLMMIVLTLIGIASTTSSTLENSISGNKRGATDAFFAADGGIEAARANQANFTYPSGSYTLVPNNGSLPPDLRGEHIDSKLTTPALNLPTSGRFTDPPTVVIYHASRVGGSGVSNSQARPNTFIIDSTGRDQRAGLTWIRAQCEIREKLVVATTGGEMEN
jgi:Tfp pilus assembly protein PilX